MWRDNVTLTVLPGSRDWTKRPQEGPVEPTTPGKPTQVFPDARSIVSRSLSLRRVVDSSRNWKKRGPRDLVHASSRQFLRSSSHFLAVPRLLLLASIAHGRGFFRARLKKEGRRGKKGDLEEVGLLSAAYARCILERVSWTRDLLNRLDEKAAGWNEAGANALVAARGHACRARTCAVTSVHTRCIVLRRALVPSSSTQFA